MRIESGTKNNKTSQPLRGSRGTMALVMGLLGLLVCQLFSPAAWYVGHRELRAARSGESTSGDVGIAKAGMILGVIGTVLLALGFVALGFVWYYWESFFRWITSHVIMHRFL